MTSKLVPATPAAVMSIRTVTDAITTLSLPFERFGLIKVGGRATLVRLKDGSVAVFSPVALTPEVRDTVKKMGELKYIAALDLEHHIFLGPWSAAYPSAKIIAPEGLREKRQKQQNESLTFDHIFKASHGSASKIDPAFDAEFDVEYVHAHVNKELVFLHRPSKTLIEADLLFNMPATEQYSRVLGADATSGIFTRIWAALNSTSGSAIGQRRFIWYAASAGDRAAFARSVQRIGGWDFERIVPCHGDVIEKEGKGIFEKVMQWHLEGKRKGA